MLIPYHQFVNQSTAIADIPDTEQEEALLTLAQLMTLSDIEIQQ